MEIVYQLGSASAAEVHARMPDPPTYTAVRGLLRILEEKCHLTHERQGSRYVYRPLVPKERAGESVLRHVVRTFFDGSTSRAVAALLGREGEISAEEMQRLQKLVGDASAREEPS